MAGLKEVYRKEVIPKMMKKFSLKNPMEIPRVEKVCINIGMGEARDDPKLLDLAKKNLALITGQQPVVTKAKKSISGFHLRKGMAIGCKVTLRGGRMYDFLERFFNLAMPRIRDFRGAPLNSFDGRGSFTLGVDDQLIFPEVAYEDARKLHGLSITIVTTADTDEEAKELLRLLGIPFQRRD